MRAEAATSRLLRVSTRRRGWARHVEATAVHTGRHRVEQTAASTGCSWARGAEGGRHTWRQLLVGTSRWQMRAEAATSRLLLVWLRRSGWASCYVEAVARVPAALRAGGTRGGSCLWAPAGGKCEPRLLRRGCCAYARGAVGWRDAWRQLLLGTSRWQMGAEAATSRLRLVCTRAVVGRDTLRLLRCAPARIERSRQRRRGCWSCARGAVGGRNSWRAAACGHQQVAKGEPRRLRRGCCSCACGDVEGRDTLRLLLCAHAGIERSRRRRRGCCSCACGDLAARDDGGVRGGSGPIDRQVDDHALKQALARAVASWGGGRDTESTRRGTRIQVGGLIRASMDGRQRKYRSGQANIGVVAM